MEFCSQEVISLGLVWFLEVQKFWIYLNVEYFPETIIVGCSGNGVIGNSIEVENRSGVALSAAKMPNVSISPFHITDIELPDGDQPPERWEHLLRVEKGFNPKFIIQKNT